MPGKTAKSSIPCERLTSLGLSKLLRKYFSTGKVLPLRKTFPKMSLFNRRDLEYILSTRTGGASRNNKKKVASQASW